LVLVLILANIGGGEAAPRYVLMWHVKKDVTNSDLQLLKSKGVNLIQAGTIFQWSDNEIKNYLDRARAYNMGVVFSLVRLLVKSPEGSYTLDNRAAAIIDKWKSHPAVFAWHTIDEPSDARRRISARDQEAIYNFVKRLDPSHPIFASGNWIKPESYRCCFSEKAFDILDIHAYSPEPGKRQARMVKQFLAHRKGNYPVIITLKVSGSRKRPKWPADALLNQYNFFFKQNHITSNIGFFAWELAPGVAAISNDPGLKQQFLNLKF